MNYENRKLVLCIDPSFVSMGICIYNPKTKSMDLQTGHFHQMLEYIKKNYRYNDLIAVVENPALNPNVFGAWDKMKKEIQKYKTNETSIKELESVFLRQMKRGQSVGKSKAAAELIISTLEAGGIPVEEVAPSARRRASYKDEKGKLILKNVLLLPMPTKTTKAQFKKLTGYSKRSSEHSRDAATLTWGRGLKNVETKCRIKYAKKNK